MTAPTDSLASLAAYVDGLAAFVGYTPPSPPPPPSPDPSVLFADGFDTVNPAWMPMGANPASWGVSGGIVQQKSLTASDPRKLILIGVTVPADVQITARVRVDSWASGDYARAGVGVRTDAGGRGYCLCLRDGGLVRFLNDGIAWGNGAVFGWVPGKWYWMKLAVSGSTLKGKVWLDGEPEPADWLLTQSSWTTHSTGSVALVAGSAGVASSYDDVTVTGVPIPPPPPPGAVNIAVSFVQGTFTDGQKQAFQDAAAFWGRVVIGPARTLPISASALTVDGRGGILGSSSWTTIVANLPASGAMGFDTADLAWLESTGDLPTVIRHEMGHVLGIGTLWSAKLLVTGTGTADPEFTGANATAAYNQLFGASGSSVPVEAGGGNGTAGVHWRDSTFGAELMTGYLNSGQPNPCSLVTVQSLADIGWTVNPAAAEAYTPPGKLRTVSEQDAIQLPSGLVIVGEAARHHPKRKRFQVTR